MLGRFEDSLRDHDPGVVDEDVDPPEAVHCRADKSIDVVASGDVGLDGDCVATPALDLPDGGVCFNRVGDVVDDDAGTVSRKAPGDGEADPACRPGHDSDLASKSMLAHPARLLLTASVTADLDDDLRAGSSGRFERLGVGIDQKPMADQL